MNSLIPQPVTVEPGDGAPFAIAGETTIVAPAGDPRAAFVAKFLADLVTTATIPAPKIVYGQSQAAGQGAIVLSLDGTDLQPEHYTLTVSQSGVEIRAKDAAGLFYGAQTLRQLLPIEAEYEASRPKALSITPVRITDGPRFAWRGAMLDVARHFFSIEDVKRYIDLIALYKMNRLHLHLADDQGWRIEIKSWPNLTNHGGKTEVGGGPGGFYTQAQYADLVSYAADRFVTIVPEIDMPGHTNAALASYAELNCDGKARELYTGIEVGFSALCVSSETTYKFIDEVVGEIAAMTPGPYFHIGGDEVKTLSADEYRTFIARVHTIVQKHGKQTIGWDEIADVPLDPPAVVQHWRPDSTPREAAARGAKIIVSPANRLYLDMKYHEATPIGLDWAARIEVRDAYDWEPGTFLEGVPESAILGLESPIWSETLASMRDVEYLAFPRLPAAAELAWAPSGRRAWDGFAQRLGAQAGRWAALGINFYRSPQVPWRH